MTIGNAQSVFEQYGKELGEFYTSVYKNLIRNEKTTIELPNSNYLHALQLTSLMLRNTSRKFVMLGGSTTAKFVGILRDEFCLMLTRLRELGGSAKFIVINADENRESLAELVSEFPKVLEVGYVRVGDEEKAGHYIVADDMVRIEEPHPRLTEDTPANAVKARVIFNSSSLAVQYVEQFDALWGVLRRTANA